ncbi:MAG: DUF4136 domain-containing protein [Xanthomonadaceae bacterium]|nr:DUF4136 domain-containing protein [Xanthomonadaceae bacterium]
MNAILRSGLLLLAVGALAACAVQRVATDYDSAVPFHQLESFAWLEPAFDEVQDPVLDSALLGRKIQRAAMNELVGRGYIAVHSDADPDFFITYHTTSRERIRDSGGISLGIGIGGGYRRSRHSIFVGDHFGRVESYQEGTLILDVINARTRDLIWRGWMRGSMHPSRYTDEAVDTAVREILAEFPPSP